MEDVRSAARSFAGITFSEGGSKVAVASAQDVWSSRMKIDQRPKRLLTREHRATSTGQKSETVVESRRDLRD